MFIYLQGSFASSLFDRGFMPCLIQFSNLSSLNMYIISFVTVGGKLFPSKVLQWLTSISLHSECDNADRSNAHETGAKLICFSVSGC